VLRSVTRTCLLITERFEPTADLLVAELRRRNVPCLRWNLDRYPVGSVLTFRASDSTFGAEIAADGRSVDLDDVGSIWCRGFHPKGFPPEICDADRRFAETEAERMLVGLLTSASPLWINHPHRHILANSKPAQLFMAGRVGLDFPLTLISNDPDEVRAFVAKSEGQIVYKALSQNLDLELGKSLFTSVLTEKELAHLDLIRLSPGIFQQFVAKSYEVRATIVGSRILSAKIDSQANVETRIDWRHRPFDIETEPIALPPEIEAKIHAFMSGFGLLYGAFDFIVTPEGRHVFLEVNPAGQYMWVESATGLPITAALADRGSRPAAVPEQCPLSGTGGSE
jgi:hypothetical protein